MVSSSVKEKIFDQHQPRRHIHTCKYIHACDNAYIHIYIHTYRHTYADHTFIHMYTHIHTYTHTSSKHIGIPTDM